MSHDHLVIYGRPECHLCQDMLASLEDMQQTYGYSLHMLDVDEDPELQAQYGLLVPVLMLNGREICHYHLDLLALMGALSAANLAKSE